MQIDYKLKREIAAVLCLVLFQILHLCIAFGVCCLGRYAKTAVMNQPKSVQNYSVTVLDITVHFVLKILSRMIIKFANGEMFLTRGIRLEPPIFQMDFAVRLKILPNFFRSCRKLEKKVLKRLSTFKNNHC